MRIFLLITFMACGQLLLAQASDHTKLVLLIQNEQKEGIKYETVTITGKKNKTPQIKQTEISGKVIFKVRKNDIYTISFADAPNFKTIEIKKDSRSMVTKRIIYEGSKSRPITLEMDTITQWLNNSAEATEEAVLSRFMFVSPERKPLSNLDVWLMNDDLKKTYYGKTNRQGRVQFLLPKGRDYVMSLKDAPKYKTISIPNIPHLVKQSTIRYVPNTLDIVEHKRGDTIYQTVPQSQKATRARVRVQVTIQNLDHLPLPDEKVFMISKKKQVYTATTGEDGVAIMMIPKGDTFSISFEYERGIEDIYYAPGNYIRNDRISYRYIGSKVIKARIKERAAALAIRDSLYAIGELGYGITSGVRGKEAELHAKKLIEERAKKDRELLKTNPKLYEEREEEVNAVLYRMLTSWKNKIIVTDVTGSMQPHMDQVLIWHALQLNAQEKNQYFFFNDGDQKKSEEKVIGETGGIYYNGKHDLEPLITIMCEAMNNGSGGESPENDIEALLVAAKKRKGLEEIILVADNYSDMRDLELMVHLNVPIRIILAGVGRHGVNEQYLELAYHTGGSIHTIEQDVFDLKTKMDGEIIIVGKHQYKIMRGKFIQIGKL